MQKNCITPLLWAEKSPHATFKKTPIIMKSLFFACLIGSAGLVQATNTYAQTTTVSLHVENQTVGDVLQQIESKTDFSFFYNNRHVDLNRRVSVSMNETNIFKILDAVFDGTDVVYQVVDNRIVLSKRNETLPLVQQSGKKITGTVLDATGMPVIGANVMVKGTTNGTITDMDGKFSLDVEEGAILVVSYIGFSNQEIKVGNQTSLSVTLKEDAEALDELVVVGYGTQKKVNLTGSVATVDTKELETRANTNMLASIQGQVPGATIISRPGSDPSINIRGRGNLGTSAPLFVIDGAISDVSVFSNLDPTSIESVSFLKDAASSAIYGSRAAYGVVLVKTKGGQEGKVKVSYDGNVTMKIATYIPKTLNSEWYARLYNEATLNENPNAELPYSEEEIQMFRDGSNPDLYPNTDWYDLIYDNTSAMTKHSVSVSGGNKVKYYTSLGYLYDDAFIKGSHSNRYNMLVNLSSDITNWLSWRSNIKYIQNTTDNKKKDPGYGVLTTPPIYVARQSNGEWGSYMGGKPAPLASMNTNGLRVLEEGGWSNSKTNNSLMDFAVDIKPIKGLTLTGEMIYNIKDYKSKNYDANKPKIKDFLTGQEINSTDVVNSQMTYDWYENSRLTYNGLINYNWSNELHNITFLGGVSYEHYKYEQQKSWRRKFPTNGMTGINGGSTAPGDMSTEGNTYEDKLMSYFTRINYVFKDRYMLEANLRADASSRFHKDNRWGIFPSFSAGWRINQEGFMQDVSWIDNLKLRASWGQLGNINNVGQYDYFSTYNQGGNYNFENTVVSGIQEGKPANINLGWETVTLTNVGVDFDILKGLLSFTGEFYDKQTKDILLGYPTPKEVGISTEVSQNIGRVSNKGLEFKLTHSNQIGDFAYSVGVNLSKNWNEVIDLGGKDPMIDGTWIKKEGQPIGTFYGYRTDGLLTQEDIDNGNYITDGIDPQAGDIKYVDLDHDGALTDKDRDYIGCDVPDFTYGININLQYKNFDLSIFGQGVTGTEVYFHNEQAWAFSEEACPREWHLKRWTVDNPDPNAPYPRIYTRTSSRSSYNQKFSDFWLFDSDYFRIKNITFGYNFTKNQIQHIGLEALRLYIAAENPFTIRADHRMEDFDPESASGRGGNLRGTTSLSLGVNVTF